MNIVLATDHNYLLQTILTIESVIKNAQDLDLLCFYILTDGTFRTEDFSLIRKIEKRYGINRISVLDINDEFRDSQSMIEHITRPTFFRLLLPEVLTCDRCLYFDSDIIVLKDLSELYQIDLKSNLIAGRIAPAYCTKEGTAKTWYATMTGLNDLSGYINAGVLIMDLEKLRQIDFVNRARELAKNQFPSNDQDIINLLCYRKISYLPFKYNVSPYIISEKKELEKVNKVIEENMLNEARNAPVIVHYSHSMKPWEFPNTYMAGYWWDMCRESVVQKELFEKYDCYNGMIEFKSMLFSGEWFEELKKNNDIYVYGAGEVARRVLALLLNHNVEVKEIFVSEEENMETRDIYGIRIRKYDGNINPNACILIATNKRNMIEIRRKLVGDGIRMVVHTYLGVKDCDSVVGK